MEKIFNFLNNLPRDKKDHALFGLLTYSFIALYSANIAISVVMVQAIGKEVYDAYHKDIHTADRYDALATFIIPMVLWIIGVLV